MIYFKPTSTIHKRILFSTGLIIFFGMGISLFFTYRFMLSGYNYNYLKSYLYAGGYKISQLNSLAKAMYFSNEKSTEKDYTDSVPILVYHGLLGGDMHSEGEATNIDTDTFWDHMKALKENGWQTITMQDFYDFKRGIKTLPPKSFLLTFDDGRKDSYYPADPILKALGFHAVMFVIDKYSLEENSSYYLSKKELEQMIKSPAWEIQSHGYASHTPYPINSRGDKGNFFSNKLWLQEQNRLETTNEYIVRVTNDLQKSKDDLWEAFGKPIIAFAFPFGDYGINTQNFPESQRHLLQTTKDIYPLSFYQYSSVYRYSQSYYDPEEIDTSFFVRRIGISPDWNGDELVRVFERGTAKNLPFTAKMNTDDGWINTNWGTMSFDNGKMRLASLRNNTGSTVFLDGSRLWKDYVITANVSWLRGGNTYLIARYKDDNNFTACNFKKDLVHIEQMLDGNLRVISGVRNTFDPRENPFQVKMTVNGRNVDCEIVGNITVTTEFLERELSRGGIGIKTWDSEKGNADLSVNSLSIVPIINE